MTKPKRKKNSSGQQHIVGGLNDSSGQDNTPTKKARYVEETRSEGERDPRSTGRPLSINDRLTALEERVEESESLAFDLQEENVRLRNEVDRLRRENNALRDEMRETRQFGRMTNDRIEHVEAWGRQWNLRIWGITGDSPNESTDDCIERVLSFIRVQLGLFRFPRDALEIAHRLGKHIPNQHRRIIVRFMRRTDRAIVLGKRYELRGTPYQLTEDLTAATARLLRRAQAAAGHKNAWTRDGKVFVRLRNGRSMSVEEGTPLDEIFDDSPDERLRASEKNGGTRRHPRYFRGKRGGTGGGAPAHQAAYHPRSSQFVPPLPPPPPPPPSSCVPSYQPSQPPAHTSSRTPHQTRNLLQWARRSASADARCGNQGGDRHDDSSQRRDAQIPPDPLTRQGNRYTGGPARAIPGAAGGRDQVPARR